MKHRTSIIMVIIAIVSKLPCISYAGSLSEKSNPEVSDIQDTGCLNNSLINTSSVIVLIKEGDIVTCQLLGVIANCGVDHFDINSRYVKSSSSLDSLFIYMSPINHSFMDCNCPRNVSFPIRNVSSDCFFLDCWLYTGMVSFKECNKVTIELSREVLTIDGSRYYLYKPGQQASLISITDIKGEVRIPASVCYEGKDYNVVSFNPDGFNLMEMSKLIIPETIRRLGEDNREFKNIFNVKSPHLEAIEVEPGNPLFGSVDGVLYSADLKTLYCLPAGKKLQEYTVINGAEEIGTYAFSNSLLLKTIRIPETVKSIRPSAFYSCNNLEAIYIQGKLNRDNLFYAFIDMLPTITLYVPESDMEFYKTIYKGPVLPISSSGETLGISDVNRSATNLSEPYNLQGRRLSGKPAKGVYIENGRKRVK